MKFNFCVKTFFSKCNNTFFDLTFAIMLGVAHFNYKTKLIEERLIFFRK